MIQLMRARHFAKYINTGDMFFTGDAYSRDLKALHAPLRVTLGNESMRGCTWRSIADPSVRGKLLEHRRVHANTHLESKKIHTKWVDRQIHEPSEKQADPGEVRASFGSSTPCLCI